MSTPSSVIPVQTASADYLVVVGHQLLGGLGDRLGDFRSWSPRRALLVADDGVSSEATNLAIQSLQTAGLTTSRVDLHPSEADKSLATFERVHQALADAQLERNDVVVALGGGIVGDIAGFAAATWQRGMRIMQCPSTLLAMVDASVGGKTGVNLQVGPKLLKNMVGCFHQPALVLADVALLETLPRRHLAAGLAECLKHGLLAADFGQPDLWSWTFEILPRVLELDPAAAVELVARNVAVKARVVGQDERELAPNQGRALLNLGHTFAHAIETLPEVAPAGHPDRAPLLHGEAVGVGLLAAARCAVALHLAPASLVEHLTEALQRVGLPMALHGLPDSSAVLERMRHDKKVRNGRIRLVLPVADYRCITRDEVDEAHIRDAIDSLRA